jgi:NADH-quinone oxidoreductase subunit C
VIALPATAPKGVIKANGPACDLVCFPTLPQYLELVGALKKDGFEVCVDVCGVDYLEYADRDLPAKVKATRFEVVVNLLSMSKRQRVKIRVQAGDDEAVVPSLFALYPGTEAMEREAFDMLGIVFRDHPDLTRILMPEDWEGHPLRKDYALGRIPVQFKESPGPR